MAVQYVEAMGCVTFQGETPPPSTRQSLQLLATIGGAGGQLVSLLIQSLPRLDASRRSGRPVN